MLIGDASGLDFLPFCFSGRSSQNWLDPLRGTEEGQLAEVMENDCWINIQSIEATILRLRTNHSLEPFLSIATLPQIVSQIFLRLFHNYFANIHSIMLIRHLWIGLIVH